MLSYFSLRRLDLMRMVVGIMIIIDGYPLIFFFKETLRLAPSSTAFTAAVLALGYLLMVPTTFLRKFYKGNSGLIQLGMVFLFISIFYMFFYPDPGFNMYTQDMLYYLYIFVFFILLFTIPNDIIEVFIPTVVAFTVVSNIALVYALLTDPTWNIGQRAAIQYGEGEYRSGNPHVFARNALICVVACGIWATDSKTGFLARLIALFSCIFSMGILLLTQTRSSVVALILIIILFVLFNFRPAQIKSAVKGLFKPVSLVIIAILFFSVSYFMRQYYDLIAILYGYGVAFFERNMENVYALLGMKVGNQYVATFDDSAGNRAISFGYLNIIIEGHQHVLLYGQGYKSMYLDIPLAEALINHGIFGFCLFAAFVFSMLLYSFKAMRQNPDPLSTFLAYFFILIFVQCFTNGRPYDIFYWHPFCLMMRFMGMQHLFPNHVLNHPRPVSTPTPAVAAATS